MLKGWTCDVVRATSTEIQLATSKRNRRIVSGRKERAGGLGKVPSKRVAK